MKFQNNLTNECTWIAYLKKSPECSCDYDACIETISKSLPSDQRIKWPIAYLCQIFVNDANHNKGLGSRGLEDFEKKSRFYGAELLMAWVSDSETSDDKLKHFYSKNEWVVITREPPACMLAFKFL